MTTGHFDKAATDWDKKQRRVQLAAKISTAIARLPLSADMDALEYGCGTGLVGLALAPALGHLTCIDTSQGMLDVLQEKIRDQGISNVRPLRCDLLIDDYSKRHDLIFCAMTLHHIQESDTLLLRFAELLKQGGYLALADLAQEDGSFHDSSVTGVHHHGFDREQLAALLTAAGLIDVKSEIIHIMTKGEEEDRKYPVFLLTGHKA
ncbi:MAG: class I SAM-dependent methyltransferase [Proteobacteria bacterium]|nr:class I SAM-dependent methyltransferase [Pseudomonadota bacterium]MBU1420836.1 class I SAM-dependent methyltransferase [Pseudomonadota bacterium]MBU1453501.1 class I SAM-dependent methyltransferase [Pseudomonadota bacterium]